MNRSDLRFAIEEIAIAVGENKWFRNVIYSVDSEIRIARLRLESANFFSRRKRRDELLDQMGYGVQTLLRAACLIHAQGIDQTTPATPDNKEQTDV